MRTLVRAYTPLGAQAGVLSMPSRIKGAQQQYTLYLPNSIGFADMWDKANEPSVVLDKRPQPVLS